MSQRLYDTMAALKFAAYGGPVALAMTVVGGGVMAVVFWDHSDSHGDILVVGGVTLLILGWVEIALARRFRAHEIVEERQYKYVASIADSAAQSLTALTKAAREHTISVDSFRAEVGTVRVDMAALTKRVVDIEDRYMRPAMLAPNPRRPPGEIP